MASLKRSSKSFRRQGSSGLVWSSGEDSADEIHPLMKDEGRLAGLRHCRSIDSGRTAVAAEANKAKPPVWRQSSAAPPAKPPLPDKARKGGFAKFFEMLFHSL